MDSLVQELLPAHDGLLPKWLLFISIVSVGNSIQTYISTAGSEKVYNGSEGTIKDKNLNPVNPLSSRTFGTWTLLSCIIRGYAAYNIDNPAVYQLALWSFGIAFAHFGSEWLHFGTTRWGKGLAGPVIVSTSSMFWMLSQWKYYLS